MKSLALGHHSNRRVGFRRIVPGCLGRAYRDVHHPIGQLGCSAGQEGDRLGESARGISIITTLPRPRHGDYLFICYIVDDTRSHMVFFPLDVMGVGKRPEKHLVSMSCPHSRIILGSVPILCPALHALSESGSSL